MVTMIRKATKAALKTTPASAPTSTAPAEKGKLAKAEITDQIAQRAGLACLLSGEAVETTVEIALDALKDGKSVSLPGLGVVSIKETAAQTGVRPGTSDKIQIPAGKKIFFKVATGLKEAL